MNTHILPVNFNYHDPLILEEALNLLSRYAGEAQLLAGGTDLLVNMKQRIQEPKHLINIKKITALQGLEEEDEGLRIGSATRLRDLERSSTLEQNLPMLHEAVKSIGSVQIRNMATIGGNLCHASPAADTAVALLSLDAEAHLARKGGTRTVPLESFFISPGLTVLREEELLTSILIPNPPPGSGSSFLKIGRTGMDIATVNTAVTLMVEDGTINDCRIAIGAVAPTPVRIHSAESFLKGKELNEEVAIATAELASEEIEPITDIRAGAEYRSEASKALVRDALTIAWKRAEEG